MIVPILFIPLIFEVYAFIFIGLWFLLQISGGMLDSALTLSDIGHPAAGR